MGNKINVSIVDLTENYQKIICTYVEKINEAEKKDFDSVIVFIATHPELTEDPLYKYWIGKIAKGLLDVSNGALLGMYYEVETQKEGDEYIKFDEQLVKAKDKNLESTYIAEHYIVPVNLDDIRQIVLDESFHYTGVILVDIQAPKVEFIDVTREDIGEYLEENKKYWYCFKLLYRL